MILTSADTAAAAAAYFTVAEVAARLRITKRTVYELVSSGQLSCVRPARTPGSRGTIRIPAQDLADYEKLLRARAQGAA